MVQDKKQNQGFLLTLAILSLLAAIYPFIVIGGLCVNLENDYRSNIESIDGIVLAVIAGINLIFTVLFFVYAFLPEGESDTLYIMLEYKPYRLPALVIPAIIIQILIIIGIWALFIVNLYDNKSKKWGFHITRWFLFLLPVAILIIAAVFYGLSTRKVSEAGKKLPGEIGETPVYGGKIFS